MARALLYEPARVLRKKAVVVGISDYGRLNAPLPGCRRDMQEWRDLLHDLYLFPPGFVRTLSDSRATKAEILDRLAWLFEGATHRHQLVFIFAGHGARIRRRDTLDEALVAYPSADDDDFLLYDDELAQLISNSGAAREATVTFILDACHSTGMPGAHPTTDAGASPDAPVPRCCEPPLEVHSSGSAPDDPNPVRLFGMAQTRTAGPTPFVVAAAHDIESAWDARMPDGHRHGAFSYHAIDLLRMQPTLTHKQLLIGLAPRIASSFPQHPRLLGDLKTRSGKAFLT